METQTSLLTYYSWEEFGLILSELYEKVSEKYPTFLFEPSDNQPSSCIISSLLNEFSSVGITTGPNCKVLSVGFNNKLSNPDVCIVNYINEDPDYSVLKDAMFYHVSSIIDVEGREARFSLPWEK